MRGMNKIKVLPPSACLDPRFGLPSTSGGSKGRVAEGQAGTENDMSGGSVKRRRGNKDGEGRSAPELGRTASDDMEAQALPRMYSVDSGAEAEEETSSESKDNNRSERSDIDTTSAKVDLPLNRVMSPGRTDTFDEASSATPVSADGTDRAANDVSSGSNGDSAGQQSTRSETGGGTSNATSIDIDMSDAKADISAGTRTAPSSHLDEVTRLNASRGQMTGRDHEAWSARHRPGVGTDGSIPPSSPNATRLKLPTTGGFIWTAGDDRPGSVGTARPLNSADPGYLSSTTLSDLQAAHASCKQPDGPSNDLTSHSGATPALTGTSLHSHGEQAGMFASLHGSTREGYKNLSSRQTSYLRPGIHADKFVLVEFEPGVGARDLDVYTDRMGRQDFSSNTGQDGGDVQVDNGKGKDALDLQVSNARYDQNGLNFTALGGVPYHVPSSAYPVGSTSMTIGGFGYLARAYGLSLDNIVELDIVLADGRLKTLSAASATSSDQEDVDLWWAARGAAPCFGIVTRMVAKAYPVPRVYAGNLIYPFNPATAPSLLRHWRDCLKGTGESVPRELYSNLILTAGPPEEGAENVIVIQICYLGTGSSEEVGYNFVQAINSWTGERVLLKDVGEKSLLSQQDGVAQLLKSGQRRRWMVRGDLLTTLTDEVIARSVSQFSTMGDRAVWLFELVGGAIEDEAESGSTCVGKDQRRARFIAGALQQWVDSDDDNACVRGVMRWVNDILAPVSVGGPFAAFLERGESRSRCEGAFGKDNFDRLLQIKRNVDPSGLFCHTFGRGLVEFAKNQVQA